MRSILLCVFVLLSVSAIAQDKIITRDGDIINAKVKEVGIRNIIYKHSDNPDGPEYTINKQDVDKIKYQNGSEVEFEDAERGPHRQENGYEKKANLKYSPNILAFAPLQLTENGIGIGASYERGLDKYGIVALYLPFYVTFDQTDNYGDNINSPLFYFAPGLKFYPSSNRGIVKYSVGPSFVIAGGTISDGLYGPYPNVINSSQSVFKFGVMVNNTLNINPSPHIYLGLELGLGGTYINRIGGDNQGSTGLVQFAFRVGYRF